MRSIRGSCREVGPPARIQVPPVFYSFPVAIFETCPYYLHMGDSIEPEGTDFLIDSGESSESEATEDVVSEPVAASLPVPRAELLPTRRALALKFVDIASNEKLSEFCTKNNISLKNYQDVMEDEVMFEDVWDLSFKMLLVPQIPEIMQRWADKCKSGNIPALKLLMQYKGKSAPEQHAHVHLHRDVSRMNNDELDSEIKETMFQIKALEKEAL